MASIPSYAFTSDANAMRTLCLIPARGGSKRIPRKNIRPLQGRPLLAWTVALAREAAVFTEVVVSTDDAEIAEIARMAGASVPWLRSPEASHDHAGTGAVITEVLASYRAAGEPPFDLFCCLYPAAVLLRTEHLRAGFERLRDEPQFDSCLSVQAYRHPIERAYHWRGEHVTPVNPATLFTRTQDLEPAYHDAGQFYWSRPDAFARHGRLLGDRCSPVLLAPWEAVDLDSEADWQFLERLLATRTP